MAGARKFALEHLTRSDLCALTREAADVSGIPYVMEADKEEMAEILQATPAPAPKSSLKLGFQEKVTLNL